MKQYYIKATIEVYTDNYQEGQGKCVNCWTDSSTINAEKPIDAVESFFEKVLYLSFQEENAHIDDESNGVNVLMYSNQVDEDNSEVLDGSSKAEAFKNGEKDLFVANSYIQVFELVPAVL